jgi:predicted Zn-dependent protease
LSTENGGRVWFGPFSDHWPLKPDQFVKRGTAMDIVKEHEELLKLDPGFEAFAPLAEELCARALWSEAVSLCRQGLSFHPEHFRGRVLLGWALMELGESEEAEKALRKAEGQIQKNAQLFKLLAQFAEQAGDGERMERLLSIYRNLGSMTLDPAVPPQSKTEAAPEAKAEDTRERYSARSKAAVLLSCLLERFTAKPINMIDTHSLFTAEDRQALARILTSRGL